MYGIVFDDMFEDNLILLMLSDLINSKDRDIKTSVKLIKNKYRAMNMLLNLSYYGQTTHAILDRIRSQRIYPGYQFSPNFMHEEKAIIDNIKYIIKLLSLTYSEEQYQEEKRKEQIEEEERKKAKKLLKEELIKKGELKECNVCYSYKKIVDSSCGCTTNYCESCALELKYLCCVCKREI